MVLEYLIRPHKAVRHPWELFFLGLLYPSIAILLSLWVFKNYVSFNMVALTTIAALPLIYSNIRHEEKKDFLLKDERLRLRSHSRVLSLYLFLFLGSVVAFSLWYIYAPVDLRTNIFGVQEATIMDINTPATGAYLATDSYVGTIFYHNLKLLIFCIVFSLFFGAGALYLLTFNASIIGTAVGMFVQERMGTSVSAVLSLGLFRYLTHGVFEIAGFFLAGLAGGIVSVAIIRHDYTEKKIRVLLQDALSIVGFALLFLFLGALVEVHVTPWFY